MRYTQLRIFSAPKIFHIWLPNVENTSAAFLSRLVAPLDFLVGTALHTVLSLILINNIKSAAFKGELALSSCWLNHGRYCAESLACFSFWGAVFDSWCKRRLAFFHANLRCSVLCLWWFNRAPQANPVREGSEVQRFVHSSPSFHKTDRSTRVFRLHCRFNPPPPGVFLRRVLVEDVEPEVRRANRALRCDEPRTQSRLTGKQTNIKGSVFCVLQGTAGNDGPPGPPGERVSQSFNRPPRCFTV